MTPEQEAEIRRMAYGVTGMFTQGEYQRGLRTSVSVLDAERAKTARYEKAMLYASEGWPDSQTVLRAALSAASTEQP